ncbi:RNA exonuclease 1 homolog [Nephila pilipes]|uniref:RNA exonuclease 1 homolog n=1 Tax=Nephila pilipes TaxID=299642 RepID=A0A8X6UDG5_NEPPI|nr:RNA exonuclease 1 homolog [Nephila pilipes]
MLPSNGYFKHTLCPYDKAKLCHRPYCHFRHADTDDLNEGRIDVVEDTEYLFDTSHTSSILHSTQSAYHGLSSSSYVPPSVGKSYQPTGILKTSNSSHSVIPVYNPTPISKLKELNFSQPNFEVNTYSPEYSIPSRKKKKIEEYDPTEVKCVSKKSVTFADESGIALDDDFAPAFSSSEDEIDSSITPKFSDDDLDNDTVISEQSKIEEREKKTNDIKEQDVIDEKIDEFSLVDKIIVDSKKSEKLLANFQKPLVSTVKKDTSKKHLEKVSKSKLNKSKKVDVKKSRSDNHSASAKEKVTVEKIYLFENDLNSDASQGTACLSETDYFSPSEVPEESSKSKIKDKDPAKKLKKIDSSKLRESKPSSKEKIDKTSSKSSKSGSLEKSKSKETSSKDTSKKEESKSKHDKHSEKSSSKTDKSEKHKNSKSEKSISISKDSKSEKNKSVPSKSEKASGSKMDKNERSKKSSKEAKLQDEKVSSSSLEKKNKHDQIVKSSSKSLDSPKLIRTKSKGDNSENKTSKRKSVDSDSEKCTSKEKSSTKKLKREEDDGHDSSMDGADDDVIDISSDSDADINEECWKIFNETYPEYSQNTLTPDKKSLSSEAKAAFRDITIMRKKRLAHAGAVTLKPNAKRIGFKQPVNPGQVMLERFAKIREAQQKRTEEMKVAEEKKAAEQKARAAMLNAPGKIRISAVTNHSLLAAVAEKNRINNSSSSSDFAPLPPTVSKTLKVTKRVAHVPDVAAKPRPVIPIDYGSKVPTVVRQKFLNAFIDEYLKFSSSEGEAYENALDEEKKAYQRSSSKAIYMNVASNALNRLRHRKVENGTEKKSDGVSSTTNSSVKTVSHEAVLNGPQAQRASFSIERKKTAPVAGLRGAALYEHLLTYILTEDQLKENGFPLPHHSELGKAVIEGVYASRIQYCNDPFKRTCSRCQKTYYVNVDGDYVRDEECDFHWGRLWKRRVAGNFESRYTCCQGDSESDGCCVGTGHVFEGSEAHALKGFVSTLPKTPPPDGYYGIYALDCEMCYTTAGVELTRISVIDPDLKTVYESFVKPFNKVLDYNTRFSGITEDNLKNVRTTIRDVQAVLLCMFNDKTILIGHSLESDLKALKIFHRTVVDTSVVFPHKMGLPYKRALRTLMVEKLSKIIQNDVGGHDSNEDAISCMELMLWRVKEDLKVYFFWIWSFINIENEFEY